MLRTPPTLILWGALGLACFVSKAVPAAAQVAPADSARALLEVAKEVGTSDNARTRALAADAARMALVAGDTVLAVEAYRVEGVHFYFEGLFDEALERYAEGLRLARAATRPGSQAAILNELGTLVKKQGDLEASERHFRDALARSQEASDSTQLANSMNNLGIVMDVTDRFDEAMALFMESADIKEAIGDLDGLTYNYDNMGQATARRGRYDEARTWFGRAAGLRRELGDETGYAIVVNNVGELFLMQDRPVEALDRFNEALAVAERTHFHDFRRHVHGQRATALERLGRHEEALGAFRAMTAIKDSLFNEDRNRQLAEMRAQLETEEKEHTIALQGAELAERQAALERNYVLLALALALLVTLGLFILVRRSREQVRIRTAQMHASIQSQEAERKRIARDLHDGLGQLISTARLQVAALENVDAGRSVDALNDMHIEVRNIAFNLMPETLLREGPVAAVEELGRRLEEVGFFRVTVSALGVERYSEAVEIDLYRMVQEWLNNVAKHAGAGEVTIQFVSHDDELVVMVEDDGQGFDTTRLGHGPGHGWTNLEARAEHLRGRVVVDSLPGVMGTTFTIRIPGASLVQMAPAAMNRPEGRVA